MADASLRNMGRVCLDTVTEGADLLIEERRQTSQRRSTVSENAKYLVLHRMAPTKKVFRDSYSMMEFARDIIRPRQLKLTRIKEIILSNSAKTKDKYIKLVYSNKGKGCDEYLKLIFDDSSMFSRWTLALSALVYIWKWIEMPQFEGRSPAEQEEQASLEMRQIHELGPTGKQLVSDLLCNLIVNEKIRKKYWSRASKLLTELDYWNWRLPTPQEEAQRQVVYDRIHKDKVATEEKKREAGKDQPAGDHDRPFEIRRRNSAPVILSNLNELYTIPEDADQSGSNACGSSANSSAEKENPCQRKGRERVQKTFRRVSNHAAIEYTGSSDSETQTPAASDIEEDEKEARTMMATRVVHPVDSVHAAPPAENQGHVEEEGEVLRVEAGEASSKEFSNEFFAALNTLERKSKWKRKMKLMKDTMLKTLSQVEVRIGQLERDIEESDVRSHYEMAANSGAGKAKAVVDEDLLKASLWRTVVQLSMDLQREKDLHKATKLELASLECK
ncbi:hypothetical protein HOP50_01g02970 [Chloropicon primus]|uniref:Uncharacterized protein n=1 Tax=Chloropicon primus TaxID=1764295 RepID=A0A5B8MBX5_9CHLO|nr:hypothetical protein A3770_01p03070 [Chloropicon primus]UPQ97006.1 hypothetical protein HOP50_01g02970 [Chloropicon primus]|eukprot:QDZ17789.1 hypothetical protein A3770_01p03070 [Chloropicon primus]